MKTTVLWLFGAIFVIAVIAMVVVEELTGRKVDYVSDNVAVSILGIGGILLVLFGKPRGLSK